jgi:pimeloyl-ACP methyl ester carboxylesterase
MIHGLGATGDVWSGVRRLLPGRWPGSWLVLDLPGHGGSAPLDRYTFDLLTAAVADRVGSTDPVLVVGHSLGGVVGVNLACGRFGVRTVGVIGIGIKVSWAPDDIARAASLARRPVQWFESREAAAERYLRVSGLAGLIGPTDPMIDGGIAHEDDRWRLTMDPGAFAVGVPDMPRLLAEARSAVVLARGEHDPLVTDQQLAALPAESVTLPGLGHNAHVQDPDAVLSLLARIAF